VRHCIWFVTANSIVSDNTLQKVTHVAKAFSYDISIVLDIRLRGNERIYWRAIEQARVQTDRIDQQKRKQRRISDYLEKSGLSCDFTELRDASHRQVIGELIETRASSLLIIEDEPRTSRHPIFQDLATLPIKVLLITQLAWHRIPTILGAIDPLHENARPLDLDSNIVTLVREWKNQLAASWHIIHCCYIPPTLLKYKNEIRRHHDAGFLDFCLTHKIHASNRVMKEGLPENTLPDWIRNSKVDILTIGLIARSRLKAFWVGSTTTALLDSPPCDMLLITTKPRVLT
jgi:hypothetical protein